MEIKIIDGEFSVCQTEDFSKVDFSEDFLFTGKTDEENSLVCKTECVPDNAVKREDGWRAMRIEGTLDFSLTGIIAGISKVLAEKKIGVFVVSTYNTDYVLVKDLKGATQALKDAGYSIV